MAIAGFTFCICPDAVLIKEQIDKYIANADNKEDKRVRHTFWGDEDLPASFWEELTLQGLFNKPKAIIVRRAEQIPAAVWRKISTALGKPNSKSWPFFCLEVQFEKGQPKLPAHISKLKCLEYATNNKWIWQSAGILERNLQAYVKEKANARGLNIAKDALEILCAGLPCDAIAVENELEKLSLATKDGQITAKLAKEAGHQQESNIFTFINYIQNGNLAGAWKEIKLGQKNNDEQLFQFLGLLLREARMLWQISAGESPYLHPSSAESKKRLAMQIGQNGIRYIFNFVLEAELAVKSGQKQPDQALEFLVANLIRLFKGV